MSEKRALQPKIQRPHANSNFLVDLGYGDPNDIDAGFCEVVFPEFRIDGPDPLAKSRAKRDFDPGNNGRSQFLILRRGVTGMLDLYEWWNKARSGKAKKAPAERTVKITLLAEDFSPVLTWSFLRSRPVSLSYAPLNAMDGSILMESIELAFVSVEMSASK